MPAPLPRPEPVNAVPGLPFTTGTFLHSLSDRERAELLLAGRQRRWEAGEALVHRGDPADSAIVLLTGRAKVHTIAQDGVEVILEFAVPGDLLGEISAVREATRSATVRAIEEVTGIVVPVTRFRAFLGGHPPVALALLDLALNRLRIADTRRIEFATVGSMARVAARLAELTERFGIHRPAGIEIALPISQDELASWSATSRESTGRALRTLRDLGLIKTARRQLIVVDLNGLRAHAAHR